MGLMALVLAAACTGTPEEKGDTLTVVVTDGSDFAKASILPDIPLEDGEVANYDISHYRFFLYEGIAPGAMAPVAESCYLTKGQPFVLTNIVTGHFWKAEVIAYIDPDGGAHGDEMMPVASGESEPTLIAGGNSVITLSIDALADEADAIINKHHGSGSGEGESEESSVIKDGGFEITVLLPPGADEPDTGDKDGSGYVHIIAELYDKGMNKVPGLSFTFSDVPVTESDGSTDGDLMAVITSEKVIPQGNYILLLEMRNAEGSDHIVRTVSEMLRIFPDTVSRGTIDLSETTVAVEPEIEITDSLGETIAVAEADITVNDDSISVEVVGIEEKHTVTLFIDGVERNEAPLDGVYTIDGLPSGNHIIHIVVTVEGEDLSAGSWTGDFRIGFGDGTIEGGRV